MFFEHKEYKLKFFNNEKEISSHIYKHPQTEKNTRKIRQSFELIDNENNILFFSLSQSSA